MVYLSEVGRREQHVAVPTFGNEYRWIIASKTTGFEPAASTTIIRELCDLVLPGRRIRNWMA